MTDLMPVVAASSPEGHELLEAYQKRGEAVLDRQVMDGARRLVDRVRQRGDRGLLRAVKKFDGVDAKAAPALSLDPGARREADRAALPTGFAVALERAIWAVERFHRDRLEAGFRLRHDGIELEERKVALRRVGIYIPGGKATYPSTAVMTVVPARLAGVEEIVVATPPSAFEASPALRHTLAKLGVTEVWGMGGAHGIAALAYGTETIRRVDKIVGPGNAWVTAAKHLVSADVGIDGLAGPTEVVIVATAGADPELLAADLLAQAEHDESAAAILVTDAESLAQRVAERVERQLGRLASAKTARASLERFGRTLLVDDMAAALEVVERIAPEHLQLVGESAERLAQEVRNAAAVFVGESTPEVFGDYVAGPSHVLPTAGTARFASALGIEDFLRRFNVVRYSEAAARRWADAAATLADAEGLPAHAAAARRRLK